MKCSECEHAKKYTNHRVAGIGASSGRPPFCEDAYMCEHPQSKGHLSSLCFTGKTCPRTCPLKK